MAQLLRDLIDIPERVHQSDFVLRLSEGVAHPAETLRDYVVTDQLVRAFGQSLDLVRRAVVGRRSMGAYLHGSFGSGKSHFMAVLHLLLEHNAEARSIPQLAPVVAELKWAEGKRFLLVPYHLVGANSLEQAVLGGYVEHVQRLHPEAPLPAVFLAEPIFDNARALRAQMGDESFFAALNQGGEAGVGGGWGTFATGLWNAESFAAALAAPQGDDRRGRLVSDLVARLLPAYRDLAASRGEGYVTLDRGLSELSKHAQGLGYQGLVLFLDELILWLASKVADLAFIAREGSKVAKLVESETADRPVPIVSFIARQRDLRELLGDHLPGAEKLSFSDTLKWSDGRFETITLEDRNLPAIARHRLLRPKNDEARRALDLAFEQTRGARAEVLTALLGREGNPDSFRDVYPFSPALVQTLVAISALLQRERTALRVMLQILVEQRDRLALGDLVPLGDLYDVIASGDEPFTEEMRIHFDHAKRLYHRKLLPMLERQHKISREEIRDLAPSDARAVQFGAHDRLLKTLLLAALVPDVEALAALNVGRLTALNHGSIRSPIPGGEVRTALSVCRGWASQVGEIKIGEDPNNPMIALQITGVDTESILEKVRNIDNSGNRKRALRELLYKALGLPRDEQMFLLHTFLWRGTKRQVEVVFANIRELSFDALRTKGEEWKLVIDFPFDAAGFSSKDDLAQLDEFRALGKDAASLAWVPAFFAQETLADLGTFVLLDYLLTGERFADNAVHLSQVDRAQAKTLLENQKSQLEQRMIQALEAAYGIAPDRGGLTDGGFEIAERFQSLDRRFQPQPPAAATLRDAFLALLDQIFTHRFPKHPRFDGEVRTPDLKKVLDVARRASATPQGRLEVERELRASVRQIANPLDLGEMHESAFVLSDRWRHQLVRGAAAAGQRGESVTVGVLRAAIDRPTADAALEPLGLPREVQDLLILVFAEQTHRSFFRYGGPVSPAPDIGQLLDELELREQALPTEGVWLAAGERAAKLFGLAPPPFLSILNVTRLRQDLRQAAGRCRASASELAAALRGRLEAFGVDPGAARQRTADALVGLLEAVAAEPDERLLESFVAAPIATSAEAMAVATRQAAGGVQALQGVGWSVFLGLRAIRAESDERAGRAAELLAELRDALGRDELAVPLAGAIERLAAEGAKLLAAQARPTPPSPLPEKQEPQPVPMSKAAGIEAGWNAIDYGEEEALDAVAAEALFARLTSELASKLDETGEQGERRLRIAWTLEARGGGTGKT